MQTETLTPRWDDAAVSFPVKPETALELGVALTGAL